MSSLSPTARTLKLLRQLGYHAGVTEHWSSYTRRRHDLFGFVDVVAVGSGGVLMVQCTSQSNRSARERKIANEHWQVAADLVEAGVAVECWGWRMLLQKPRRWTPDRRRLVVEAGGPVLRWEDVS